MLYSFFDWWFPCSIRELSADAGRRSVALKINKLRATANFLVRLDDGLCTSFLVPVRRLWSQHLHSRLSLMRSGLISTRECWSSTFVWTRLQTLKADSLRHNGPAKLIIIHTIRSSMNPRQAEHQLPARKSKKSRFARSSIGMILGRLWATNNRRSDVEGDEYVVHSGTIWNRKFNFTNWIGSTQPAMGSAFLSQAAAEDVQVESTVNGQMKSEFELFAADDCCWCFRKVACVTP